MGKNRFVEEVVIHGKTIRLMHEALPLKDVVLDENNPRIRYRLKLEQGRKSLDTVIQTMPEVGALRRDIERNGGLRERIIVQPIGKGKWKTIEGNCRTVCYRSLQKKMPNDPRWKTIPARILPVDVDERHIAILLSDFHIAGKIDWKAHEKAGQIYHMNRNLGMSYDDIAASLRTSKSTVSRFHQAYKFMVERFLSIDKGRYSKQGERKWSYFDEFFKRAELREELRRNADFGDKFCRWVGQGKLEPVDVRKLPDVLKNPEARRKLEDGAAFAEALKVLEMAEPEHVSEFFRLLAKMREACTSAAQIGEIIRIRTDKIARGKVLDTYKAFVDFMRLADVEAPQ
ncbi:MAG TPA: hypothetical protein VFS76_24865 [Pyrinomonadaceae bacterium]|nr:hypothetical protein [Pyrinomonadaceae bacterium]